ncbi:hypothetical protein MKW94_014981 [Papaver nudicaule]|uniref:Uncharacterized protein n=1 Tax=Papaver nudicaule TaxID=74823 RepID=A0AA42B5V3_PAPNU|nr:hypothetical protein [Papaver nudicaule]
MTGKAKPKKHTSKKIQAKQDATVTNRGGGKVGLVDRTGIAKGGHAKFECPQYKITAPDVKTLTIALVYEEVPRSNVISKETATTTTTTVSPRFL